MDDEQKSKSTVPRSAYRRPVTAKGLKGIEQGTLTRDEDMYNNLNTGVLEQYLEEKNIQEGFEISHWSPTKILIGILIGAVFSGVTAYIGLKIGLAVSAAWYVAYLLGMALKWSPSEVNIATSATTEQPTLLQGSFLHSLLFSYWHIVRSIKFLTILEI